MMHAYPNRRRIDGVVVIIGFGSIGQGVGVLYTQGSTPPFARAIRPA